MWFWVSSFLTLCQVFFSLPISFLFLTCWFDTWLVFLHISLGLEETQVNLILFFACRGTLIPVRVLEPVVCFPLILMLLFTILFIDDLRNLWSVSILFSCGWSLGSPWYWNICWLFLDLLYKLTSYCSGERIMF